MNQDNETMHLNGDGIFEESRGDLLQKTAHLSIVRNQLLKKLYEKSFYEFFLASWGSIEAGNLSVEPYIKVVCDHFQAVYEGKIRKLILALPPRCLKSTIGSVAFPAWVWINNPSEKMLIGSYSGELSTRDAVKNRDLVKSDWYRRFWGDRIIIKEDQDKQKCFSNTQRGNRTTFSIMGKLTGEGGGIRIIDDPINLVDSLFPSKHEKVWDFYSKAFNSRGILAATDKTIIMMQRLSRLDLVERLLGAEKDKWEYLFLPAEFDIARKCVTSLGGDYRTKDKELLTSRLTEKDLDEKKAIFPFDDYNAQYQQDTSVAKELLVKREWFMYYDSLPDKFDWVFQAYDPAATAKAEIKNAEKRSYSVCITFGVKGGKIYILDLWRDQVTISQLLAVSLDLVKKYNSQFLVVEKKSSGEQLIQLLQDCCFLPVYGYLPRTDKITRFKNILPTIADCRIYLPMTASWYNEFFREVLWFPKSDTFDIIDTLSIGIGYCVFVLRCIWGNSQLELIIPSRYRKTNSVDNTLRNNNVTF